MTYYTVDSIRFRNGRRVKAVDEAKYLGYMLNDEAQAAKEVATVEETAGGGVKNGGGQGTAVGGFLMAQRRRHRCARGMHNTRRCA